MNILLLGSGGREHAIADIIAKSKLCSNLYIAPGNPGTAKVGTNIDANLNDFENIKKIATQIKADMVVCGPEDPLAKGIANEFENDPNTKHIKFIGPKKMGAKLEGSKDFAKKFMQKYNIPTARYQSFTKEQTQEAYQFLEQLQPPYVLKADGLAGGKGVIISPKLEDAKNELDQMFSGKFGMAGNTIIIEEFLKGIEMSAFVITNGKEYVMLPEAKDYKKIGHCDTGLNTGGMGAVSPVPFYNEELKAKVVNQIIEPTIKGLQEEGIPYTGFIFFGIMNVDNNPYVIEYNVRMGDPETEAIMPRINSDFVELLNKTCEGKLADYKLQVNPQTATGVIMVSQGYPQSYEKGKEISGLDEVENANVFHMGTKQIDDKLVTAGGRVLAITSLADNMEQALEQAYTNVKKVKYQGKYFRTDIGKDLMK